MTAAATAPTGVYRVTLGTPGEKGFRATVRLEDGSIYLISKGFNLAAILPVLPTDVLERDYVASAIRAMGCIRSDIEMRTFVSVS